MGNKRESVKSVVYKVINSEIEAQRLSLARMLNPGSVGIANDDAIYISTIARKVNSQTSVPVREETVMRYVRQYKATARLLNK